jgi:single-strand DNA-binding protein
MAASFNQVTLMGNMTRDIELRYTPGGTAVTDMGLAVNEKRKDASGNLTEDTTFVDVTLWGRNAEVAAEYLGKGSPVLISGRLKLDQWETEGEKRQKLKVVCERMQMVGSKRDSGSSQGSSPASSPDDAPSQGGDDDVPF